MTALPGTGPAAVHETHTGVVVLLGDRAVKMKKPVRTDFLDFSTPALRRAACHREVELNRRLAQDVYLGVSDVLAPNGTGAVEHLVVMRRMPDDRCLATLVTSAAAGATFPARDELRALARLMAAFHARADRGPAISADATRAALRGRWTANIAELGPFAGTVLDASLIDTLGPLRGCSPRSTSGPPCATSLGSDMEDYLVLGACNPRLARRQIGLLLPCNVVMEMSGG